MYLVTFYDRGLGVPSSFPLHFSIISNHNLVLVAKSSMSILKETWSDLNTVLKLKLRGQYEVLFSFVWTSWVEKETKWWFIVTVTAGERLVWLSSVPADTQWAVWSRWTKSRQLRCVQTVGEAKVESNTTAAGNQLPVADHTFKGTFSDPPTEQ